MSWDGKEIILLLAIGTIGLLAGSIGGFVIGTWTGYIGGYDDGVDAGVNYSNCVIEETPLYSEVTQKIIDDCWETHAYTELEIQ